MICSLLFLPGTSDPYVKFKLCGKEVFRSRIIHKNLNPVWEESTTLFVDNLHESLYVKVADTSTAHDGSHACPRTETFAWAHRNSVQALACVLTHTIRVHFHMYGIHEYTTSMKRFVPLSHLRQCSF